MADRVTALNADVAAAADAWLNDPLDVGVYGRLVQAVRLRRAVLDGADPAPLLVLRPQEPALHEPDANRAPEGESALEEDALEESALEEDDDLHGSVRPVSDLLSGDPRAALERLRRGGR